MAIMISYAGEDRREKKIRTPSALKFLGISEETIHENGTAGKVKKRI